MKIRINEHVVIDSEVCNGTPVFEGTRVMVWQVLELLGAGVSIDEITTKYFPNISKKAILSIMTYVSKIIGEEKNALPQ